MCLVCFRATFRYLNDGSVKNFIKRRFVHVLYVSKIPQVQVNNDASTRLSTASYLRPVGLTPSSTHQRVTAVTPVYRHRCAGMPVGLADCQVYVARFSS